MLHQLLVHNKADCYPLIKVLGKTKQLHYKHSTFKLKDDISISGVLINYVLIKILERNMTKCKLVSSGYVCKSKIDDEKCNKI